MSLQDYLNNNQLKLNIVSQIHFDVVRQMDVADNPEYFGEIADGYYDKNMWTEALEVYHDMSECEDVIRIRQSQR